MPHPLLMEPTWHSRDLPVLDAIVQTFDEAVHSPVVTIGQLSARMGWPAELVFRACQALEGAFIDMSYVMAGGALEPQMVAEVYPAARRAVGQWPSAEQYFDRLVEALEGRTTALPDGEERTRLQRVDAPIERKCFRRLFEVVFRLGWRQRRRAAGGRSRERGSA